MKQNKQHQLLAMF